MRTSHIGVLAIVLACLSSHPIAARADKAAGGDKVPQPADNISQPALEQTAVFSWEHRLSGKVVSLKGTMMEIETRDKRTVAVDAAPAIDSHRAYVLTVGALITAFGSYDQKGVLHAKGVTRAKRLPVAWPEDR